MPSLSSTKTILLCAVAAVVAVGVAGGIRFGNRWDRMTLSLERLEAERLARSQDREALYGPTVEGRAWEHYAVALAELRGVSDVRDRARRAARAGSPEERAERDRLLVDAAAVFPPLRLGAHCRDARRGLDLRRGCEVRVQRLSEVRALSELCVARFQQLLESGDEQGAVEALLDGQQLARDLTLSPSLLEEVIGFSELVPSAMVELLERGAAPEMSIECSRSWLDGLERLVDSLPPRSFTFRADIETLGRTFELAAERGQGLGGLLGQGRHHAWRFGFSWRGAAIDFVERGLELAARVEAAQDLAPSLRLDELAELQREVERDRNPLVQCAIPNAGSTERSRQRSRTRLAFLVHALALHAGASAPVPPDLLGTGVSVVASPARISVRTRGGSVRSDEVRVELVR